MASPSVDAAVAAERAASPSGTNASASSPPPSPPSPPSPPAAELSSLWMRMRQRFRIELAEDTTMIHFTFYLLASLLTIALFVFVNGAQTFLLSLLLHVPKNDLGSTSGALLLYDQLLSILLMGTWGSMSDLVGRRVIFVFGFLIMGLALFAFPLALAVYPGVLLARLLFAVGAAASSSMVTAVLADYVGDTDRGKISGLVGLTSGLGAMFGAFVLLRLPSFLNHHVHNLTLSIQYAYFAVGAMSIVVSLLLAFTLKPRHADFFTVQFWKVHWKLFKKMVARVRDGHGATDVGEGLPPHVVIDGVEAAVDSKQSSSSILACPVASSSATTAFGDLPHAACPYLQQQQQRLQQKKHQEDELSPSRKQSLDDSVTEETAFLKNKTENAGAARPLGCTMPGVLEQAGGSKRAGLWSLIWQGFQLAWKSPYILLAYLGGFVARGDSIIITIFLPLWINTFYMEHHLCTAPQQPPSTGSDEKLPSGDPRLHQCDEAIRLAAIYSGIAQTCALVGAPLFGLLADRYKDRRSIPFLVASIVSFAGYFSISWLTNPITQSAYLYPLLCLIGFGEIGMIVTSLCLVTSNKLVKAEIRGSVAGCYSLMGVLGIMVSTEVGGVLFDVWKETAPFLVMSLLGAVAMLGGMAIVARESIQERQQRFE